MPSVITTQTDFSAGQVDVTAKRDNKNPLLLGGARQMSNFRILNSKGATNRPGRRILFSAFARVEKVLMAPGSTWFLNFGDATLKVFNSEGTEVFTEGRPWNVITAKSVVWARFDKSIYIVFPGMTPRVLTWDGVTTWTAADYAETVRTSGHKETIFYRIFRKGVTLAPSATTGSITITFSAAYLVAGMIGTKLRYVGRQITITGVTNPTTGTATVVETLQGGQRLGFAASPAFSIGDVVYQPAGVAVPEARGQVAAVTATTVDVILTTTQPFSNHDDGLVIGPTASGNMNVAPLNIAPPASTVWDEEVMNSFRGFPQSVFVDQNRLGFCNFPSVPAGVAWSEVVNFTNLEPGTIATDPIFELAPENSQVFHVVPGPEASEFVFCDNNLWYIPISETTPLQPGPVAFKRVSSDGCLNVQPRAVQEAIIYMRPGGVSALYAFGAANRPYKTDDLTELRDELFGTPVAIAIPTEEGDFPERYAYVLNDDGTLVVGKYTIDPQGKLQGLTGWVPWSGDGSVQWIAALGGDVILTTNYTPVATPLPLVEIIDSSLYLDVALFVNSPPTSMQHAQPAGTNIGNLAGGGGLAAAFDGTRSKAAAASASLANVNGFIGKNFTTPQVIGQALVWPSTDQGFTAGGTGDITIELRAKQTLPAHHLDGTLLASVTLTADQVTGPLALVSIYDTTAWAYGFINIAQSGATSVICAQLLMQTGALWWRPGGTVDLMDQETRMMGTYEVDAVGNIIPQGTGGEDLSIASLVAGQDWSAVLEPFIPPVAPGQDVDQRMYARRVSRAQFYVKDSTGFVMVRIYSGQSGPLLPAAGTVMGERRIPTWNQGEDPTVAPTLREQSYLYRPPGRSHDPRVAFVKDTPGPVTLLECTTEVTV